MSQKCDYCGKVRSDFVKHSTVSAPFGICTSCNSKASEVLIEEIPFDDQGLIELTRQMLGHGSSEERCRALVKCEVPDVGVGQLNRDEVIIKSLLSVTPHDCPPIKVKQVVNPMFGELLGVDYEVVDGWHRLAVAHALGYKIIPVFIVGDEPKVSDSTFIYGHDRPYHTLVFPNGIIPGVRDNERWEYLREEDIVGMRIIDIGSNSGMQGIMAKYLGADSYLGIEQNEQAATLGRQIAATWGADIVMVNRDASELYEIPEHDVVWLFSVAQRIPIEHLVRQVEHVKPQVVYLEWHDLVDDASANLQSQLNYEWELLAVLQSSFDNERRCRKLLRGTRIT